MSTRKKPDGNHLLAALPAARLAQLQPLGEVISLQLGHHLFEVGEPTAQALFPLSGFASLLAQLQGHTEGGHGVEVGMAGREGMLGIQLALGAARGAPALPPQALQGIVQGQGMAFAIEAQAFLRVLPQQPELHALLLRYAAVLLAQRARAAACLRFHEITPRLARWLLMSADRAGQSRFALTQEFLAAMLGVRRVGITQAATALQAQGWIRYHRGDMQLCDRPALRAAACSCYRADLRSYALGMGMATAER
ncbi:Crp/Fnr family transcriptional regulator [Paucibacter sp. APW11]|uniref:Crp/Fnr family transcriptional regulator n=1 Tax=Roseateles aquae TaxID=3077235 RepID=A0ABU3P5B4_9BURK|nr:Crp/Fnr family transcriptional regulator [Paucibacter sp. APW11]MDT8997757.1 Crp/Fnr family transcriptional regulator [Paucibacter sp. APW11]